jgi:steroid 5-alpha reductase family enzyme
MRDYAALSLYAVSLIFESIADRQKSVWRKAKDSKQHKEPFISSGLWSISRHPKCVYRSCLNSSYFSHFCHSYVGEVGIWTGIWALSTASLQSPYFPPGTAALAVISPFFTWYLLRKVGPSILIRDVLLTLALKVSGVPPLEHASDRKFGDNSKWQEYKKYVSSP